MGFFSKKPRQLSPGKQRKLDKRLFDAVRKDDTKTVQALLAAGADPHDDDDIVLRWAVFWDNKETVRALLAAGANVHANYGSPLRHAVDDDHVEMVKMLLAAGVNVHAENDRALCMAAHKGHAEMVRVLSRHIFAPELWRGKSRAEIETRAGALYDRIKAYHPLNPSEPEALQKVASILADCAIECWHQVRPAPPKLRISPLPAQLRPL